MAAARPKGWKLLKAALATRKAATMLAFGFSSGLPFALLIGTLNAWLGDAKINLATIGVLSWIGLGYAFKFLWSPLVDQLKLPLLGELGRRKSWIVLCQAFLIVSFIGLGRDRSGYQHRLVRDLRGDRRVRLGDAGHRGRRLAHRRRRRADAGRTALGGLPVRLSHRLDRRRGVRAVPRGAHSVGRGLFHDGGPGGAGDDRRADRAGYSATAARRDGAGAGAAGRDQRAGPGHRAGRRRRVLGLGDRHAGVVHDFDARGAAGGDEVAVGLRLHDACRPVDHRRDCVRAAVHRGDGQLAKSPWPRGPERRVATARRPRGDEPRLWGVGVAAGRAVGAPSLGRPDHHRLHPDLRALLQHLVELRLPLLPRLPPLHEGPGRLRVEGVRHLHDDDRHQPGWLSVRPDRAVPDGADRGRSDATRQSRLRRPCRGRGEHRRFRAHPSAQVCSAGSAPTTEWSGC